MDAIKARLATNGGPPLCRADLHLHTTFSDGRHSPRELVELVAYRRHLDVIAVTDHDTIAGALAAADVARELAGPPAVVIGEEVSSLDGHILGLFLQERVPPLMSAADTIRAIHAQGGIAVAAHPFWGVASHAPGDPPRGVGHLAEFLDFDAIETVNGAPTPRMWLANRAAAAVAARSGKPAVGGSDAHLKGLAGITFTMFSGRGPDGLRAALRSGAVRGARSGYLPAGAVAYLPWALSSQLRLNRRPAAG